MAHDIVSALQIATLTGLAIVLGFNAFVLPKATFQLLTFKGGDKVDTIGSIITWLFIIFGLSIFF